MGRGEVLQIRLRPRELGDTLGCVQQARLEVRLGASGGEEAHSQLLSAVWTQDGLLQPDLRPALRLALPFRHHRCIQTPQETGLPLADDGLSCKARRKKQLSAGNHPPTQAWGASSVNGWHGKPGTRWEEHWCSHKGSIAYGVVCWSEIMADDDLGGSCPFCLSYLHSTCLCTYTCAHTQHACETDSLASRSLGWNGCTCSRGWSWTLTEAAWLTRSVTSSHRLPATVGHTPRALPRPASPWSPAS